MELWQVLDTLVIRSFPLLAEFDPGMPVSLLYPLQLSSRQDMDRLRNVERYLEKRRSSAKSPLSCVLGEPSRDCFAARFFDLCEEMQDLYETIIDEDNVRKNRKKFELIEKSAEYDAILREATETACLFIGDEFDPLKSQHDNRRCRRHFLERKAARMRIQIHEALLPTEIAAAKAVIFELLIPPGFAAWRDGTWQILQLGQGQHAPDKPPHTFLYDYPGLKPYMQPTGCGITLGSRTKYVILPRLYPRIHPDDHCGSLPIFPEISYVLMT